MSEQRERVFSLVTVICPLQTRDAPFRAVFARYYRAFRLYLLIIGDPISSSYRRSLTLAKWENELSRARAVRRLEQKFLLPS